MLLARKRHRQKNTDPLKAFITAIIAEESPLICKGIKCHLRKFEDVKITDIDRDFQQLVIDINREKPDFVFINADFIARNTGRPLKSHLLKDVETRIILYHRPDVNPQFKEQYDFVFDLNYPLQALTQELTSLFAKIPLDRNTENNSVLSERERTILRAIAMGQTNKEIGEKLHISPLTVETHRKNITRKLGIKSVSGLTIYAVINNIIDVNDEMR